jgi:flagellar basal-body rod protein FlgB
MTNLFQSTTIPVLEQVAAFAQARHTVLAGNIANLDTPGYVARDYSVEDFQTRLKQAIQSGRQPAMSGSPGELAGMSDVGLGEVAKTSRSIMLHDQSQVGAESQVNEMLKNRIQHNIAITVLAQQFRLLQAAVSERA